MSRLIIDVTELAGWHGKLTGVPRVMDEMATRFSSDADALFVLWSSPDQQFRSVNWRESHKISVINEPVNRVQKYHRTIEAARRLKNRSRLAAKAMSVPERVARKQLRPMPVVSPQGTVKPEPGDTLLVMADWHGSDHAFVNRILELKADGLKLVQLSYDLLPIITPQYSGHSTDNFTNYVKKVYPVCDLIIAISEHTKKDIQNYLQDQKLPVPLVEVIRLGDDFDHATPKKPVVGQLENRKFLLCVGTIEARKNHALLYYTYKLAAQRRLKLPLTIIVGRRGWKTDDIFELMTSDPDTKDSMIILQNASDEELSWLYDNCLFSIYPSFYEGWGLPIAESIAHRKTCLSSNTSSMPEVAGDLINYFSPASPDECLAAIAKLLDPKELKRADEKISKYQPTSWDKSFKDLKTIIKKQL